MFVVLNKSTIFAACYNNTRQFCTTLNFATMTTKNYNLIDAINREGLGNSEWGLCQDVNTARHFGSSENIDLQGMYLYIYHTDGDTWAYLKQRPTLKVNVDDNCQVYLFKI